MSIQPYSEKDLEWVFGPESKGSTPEERANTSTREYVRSQVQLSNATPEATGHRLTAREALDAYGWSSLLQVAEDGATALVQDPDEPAETLMAARTLLNLSVPQLARATGLTAASIEKAETVGAVSPIRTLERLGQALGLDERLLGYEKAARGDRGLGVRLRELASASDSTQFSPTIVSELAEAAWVISRQIDLGKAIGLRSHPNFEQTSLKDSNYNYPTWIRGFELAERTRRLLGLGTEAPIVSFRSLVEEQLNIPLVQGNLGSKFAGATLANGSDRGIVVNERGMNENVWVRRMTAAHELGHLLWDPDQKLNKLMVDAYADLERDYVEAKRDPVEIRANAFAVSFLAPPDGIKALAKQHSSAQQVLEAVMNTYGISATAAKYHVQNVCNIDTHSIATRILPTPSDDWIGRENLGVDFIAIQEIPITRRGRFAWIVTKAHKSKAISADSAALFLRCSLNDFTTHANTILAALNPSATT